MTKQEIQAVYTNRELSWLQFNERVLEESEDKSVPLFERLRFIAIYQSNLDEFFMVRAGSLHDQMLLKKKLLDSKTKMTAREQLDAIHAVVAQTIPRIEKSCLNIFKKLSEHQIYHPGIKSLNKSDLAYLTKYFEQEIMPLVSPQIIDKRQPFPFLINKERYIAVRIAGKNNNVRLGIIPASGYFDRMVYLPSKDAALRYVLIEELLIHFAEKIFPQHQIIEKTVFRITRNADINVDDEMDDVDIDYREAMEELLKKRRKLAPVRLEVSDVISNELLEHFCKHLTLEKPQVFVNPCMDMSYIFALENKIKGKESLFYSPVAPQVSDQLNEKEPILPQVMKKDILLHYPYHSIKPFITLLNEAASDPAVISIKITLYRVASESKVVHALINAAENGKDVYVVVELRARFDEENNIDWSKRLEEAGCRVIYGLPGYKVHSKLLLITRKAGRHIEYITQIGTGNYNEKTARLYTDLSLMTANPDIAADASAVFNSLFMGETVDTSEHLLVAPHCFKPKIIALIDSEIAAAKEKKPAQIFLKMNSVTDKVLIQKLIEASCAGVQIKMLIRGICCFKPGIPGFTENIEVSSIVGQLLEHSRIFIFGSENRRRIYISSADFMTRNTERRVEVASPIYDENIKQKIIHIVDVLLNDNQKSRIQDANGIYKHRNPSGTKVNAQEALMQEACSQAELHERHQKELVKHASGVQSWIDPIKKWWRSMFS